MKKSQKQNSNKSFIPLIVVVVIVIIVAVFILQSGEGKETLPNLGGILPFGDKSLQPPALPE